MAPNKNYTKEQMANAINDVNKGVSVGVAASRYDVPRITLRNKVTGKSPVDCRFGPATILSQDEENVLVQWLFKMSDSHFPVTKDHLLDSVQKIITEKKLDSCPFKDNRPGKKWFYAFLKRHPEISERTAQNLTKARDNVTEEDLKKWFESIRRYLEEQGLLDVLNDPNRIFNTDESAFYLQPNTGKVLVRKGEKNVYNSAGDEKENLTALLTTNAAGFVAPPMIVFPYERLPVLIVNSVPNGWGIGRSETGWMNAKTFFEYITNVFNPWLIDHNIPKPVLFFLDGHRSHMTLHLANFCKDNGIEIIALYPNSTHLIQPMDVAVFRPLKTYWKYQTSQWKIDNPGRRFKKEDFAPNLDIAVKKITKDTIKNGFRKSGLFPFSVDYVDLSKIKSYDNIQNEKHTEKAANFITFLEAEIKNVLSSEKLILFNQLYYMNRTEVERLLPQEDQSLFIIWTKVKHTLTGRENENVRREGLSAQENPDEIIITPVQSLDSNLTISHQIPCAESQCNLESNKELPVQITHESLIASEFEPHQKDDDESQLQIIIEPPTSEQKNQSVNNSKIQTQTQPTSERQAQSMDCVSATHLESIHEKHANHEKNPEQRHSIIGEVTPAKSISSLNSLLLPKPSTSSNASSSMIIPSPFKRALFWPEQEVKKQLSKERLPSAITSDCWRAYMEKKENEKIRIQEEKAKRLAERKEKRILKEKNMKEKKEKANNQNKMKRNKKQTIPSSSSESDNSEIIYQESEYDVLDDLEKEEQLNLEEDKDDRLCAINSNKQKSLKRKKISESDSDDTPLAVLSIAEQKKGRHVIVLYEGEYFPGIIENVDGGYIEVSTMTLTKGNTFRWPDTPDKIWYKNSDLVEYIETPVSINKRGFYKVQEMLKYLPFIE